MNTPNSAYTLAINAAVETAKTKILEYLKNPTQGRTFGHLLYETGLRKGQYIEGLPETRVQDRALQALRKDGKIEYRDRQWFLA